MFNLFVNIKSKYILNFFFKIYITNSDETLSQHSNTQYENLHDGMVFERPIYYIYSFVKIWSNVCFLLYMYSGTMLELKIYNLKYWFERR